MAEMMQVSMAKIKEMVDVNTIVGEPITTQDGITLIPVSRVSFGFGTGGSDLPIKARPGFGGGSGAGIRIEPMGFLIIKDGNVRMMNILPPPSNTFDRLLDMIPSLMDKAEEFKEKRAAEKA
ncbi:MAG: GerW family sporulation protein [Oscillospiraceae bacterium]